MLNVLTIKKNPNLTEKEICGFNEWNQSIKINDRFLKSNLR